MADGFRLTAEGARALVNAYYDEKAEKVIDEILAGVRSRAGSGLETFCFDIPDGVKSSYISKALEELGYEVKEDYRTEEYGYGEVEIRYLYIKW